jgi:hypothetical protein
VAGAVLIGMGLPHPSSLADEARRIGFTFAGVGIAVVVMLLTNLLSKPCPWSGPTGTRRPGRAEAATLGTVGPMHTPPIRSAREH